MKTKRFLSIVLVLQLLSGQTVLAAPTTNALSAPNMKVMSQTIQSKAVSFKTYYSKMRSRMSSQVLRDRTKMVLKDIRSGATTTLKSAGSVTGHNTQTLLIIWISSMIMAVEQEFTRANLIGKKKTQDELNETFLDITNRSINKFDIFAGLTGGAVFGTTFAVPLQYIRGVIASKVSRPIFAQLLSGGATSLVTFLGWELARHLWKEAIFQLETPEEIAAAEKLLFTSVLTGTATPDEKRLFDKIVQNAWVILTYGDPDLTEAWIYNTWRLTLMTGDFVTLVMTMTAAATATSAVVGAVAPGAGHIVSFVTVLFGGVAGAYVAHHLPKQVKQPITKFLRGARSNFTGSKMHVNFQEIRRILSYADPMRGGLGIRADHIDELRGYLKRRLDLRNNIMTIHYENIFLHYMNSTILQQQLTELEIVRGKESDRYKQHLNLIAPEIKSEELELQRLANRAIEFYQAEYNELQSVIEKRPSKTPVDVLQELDQHLEKLTFLMQFTLSILSLFSPDIIKSQNIAVVAPHSSIFEEYLNGFYFFGYRESAIHEFLFTAEVKYEPKK